MQLPSIFNYIGILITLRCNFKCSYCLNWRINKEEKDVDYWLKAIDRIETDLPITLSGGEPSIHKAFFPLLTNLNKKFDLLTNLSFDIDEFIENVSVDRFQNDKDYAPIRASFHPGFSEKINVIERTRKLMDAGFRVGVYVVETEDNKPVIEGLRKIDWLDLQVKPYVDHEVKVNKRRTRRCAISELIVGPNGKIYKCHRDLYKGEYDLGELLTSSINYAYRWCDNANECHPCDIKTKRDRYGNSGYTSVKKRIY
ncbi:radical SAM protein [Candidatus Pacearchaeota archaeon]|nr:radical SAM protein [Candidatus Pacearchaeota archaeon]